MTALVAMGLSSNLFGRATNPVERIESSVAAVAVIDGGTLRVHAAVVRLAGVASPARGEACLSGSPGVDCGAAAANALATMLRGRNVGCDVRSRDSHGRALAVCRIDGFELNRAIVAAGWARADDGGETLALAEADARAGQRGMWRDAGDSGR